MKSNLIDEVAKNQKVYRQFQKIEDKQFLLSITGILQKTPWRDTVSENSLMFRGEKGPGVLKKVFCLGDAFQQKYELAVSENDHEEQRIKRLHSSALLSLLTFYSVSKENPITFELNGKEVVFTNVEFEHKNCVGKDEKGMEHDSNMDIMLYDGDTLDSIKNVLFLESKFSEYLTLGQKKDISNTVYGDIYRMLFNQPSVDKLVCERQDSGYFLLKTNEKGNHYCEGIKQMISHYMGVLNFVREFREYKCPNVYLGCILFDFKDGTIDTKVEGAGISHLEDYRRVYSYLCKKLAELSGDFAKPENLHILNECLTYQDVFQMEQNRNVLDKNVKTFYSL